ncbi:hypothetical protein L842_1697 [Mycobacterium intracellulare MIN_052511_1280]|nr:hypothetical protein L842_1697 [Mycobacterium intracellulare MIN_052511_1280]
MDFPVPHVFTDATRLIGPAATINAESRPWYLREFMPLPYGGKI